jgi:hypothetical protein
MWFMYKHIVRRDGEWWRVQKLKWYFLPEILVIYAHLNTRISFFMFVKEN